MKVAVSAVGNSVTSQVDARFGRAAWFLIVDSKSGELLEAIDNSGGKAAAHGAGIAAAALVADKGVQAVLTGRVGPKAQPVLERANVKIVNAIEGVVADAVKEFAAGFSATQTPLQGSGQGNCGRGRGQGRGMGQGRGQCRREQ